MTNLGTLLTVLIGQGTPTVAPLSLLESLESVAVTHDDTNRSGFQMSFRVGRTRTDRLDYGLLLSPLLQPFTRVLLLVTFQAMPQVLMDGIITHQQLNPGTEPGEATLTLTGEDVSVMMDLAERSAEHPAQPEAVIALKILASYAQYGLIPTVIPPPTLDIPLVTERVPVQQSTDLQYLQEMAGRFGYVFYVTPGGPLGNVPLTNRAYWGPPPRVGAPQRALSVNLGPQTNVTAINFQYRGLEPTLVEGQVQDRQTGQTLPVQTVVSTRPPLASQPATLTQPQIRRRQFRQSGLTMVQALARAQGETDRSTDQVLLAAGELDASRYGALLQPRGLVGLRGVGYSYDGFYYVKSVTHQLRKGSYTQHFTLTRDGKGALSPLVVP
ncbi:MAG: hypothetical protein KF832_05045 [Caldilineaceae bacterium]|nr:hypothetical protein [Caldilineaceae bacterium]